MPHALLALILLAIFAGALTRATFGFGEAVVSMPLLALLPVSLHTAASLVGLGGLTVALLSLGAGFRHVERATMWKLFLGTIVGIPLGLLLLRYASPRVVQLLLGAFLIAYSVYSVIRKRRHISQGTNGTLTAGLFAGALGSAYNFNGVPVAIYGTLCGWDSAKLRGTLQAHFLISGSLIVLGQALGGIWTPELPRLYLWSLPVLALATLVGHALHRRLSPRRFEHALFALIFVLGATLLAKNALGG